MGIGEVLSKHFKDEKIKYFHQSDMHRMIEGDTFLRYKSDHGFTQLWFGGDNGEVCILITNDGDVLDRMINILCY